MIRLSKRLQSVADFVSDCETMADVGTDHGYIPVYLAECGRVKRAIAMDINEGPLLRAKEHIRQYGMEAFIETRQSDGLDALAPGEAEVIVIAGMGGGLMKRILTQGEETAGAAKSLILQPQSEWAAFRKFLQEMKYQITAEDMVFEDGKYYVIIAAVPLCSGPEAEGWYFKTADGGSGNLEAGILYQYGPLLLSQRHPVLRQYLFKQQQQKQKILMNLKGNARHDAGGRIRELSQDLEDIEAALKVF